MNREPKVAEVGLTSENLQKAISWFRDNCEDREMLIRLNPNVFVTVNRDDYEKALKQCKENPK